MEIMRSHFGIGMAYDALDGLNVHTQCLHTLKKVWRTIQRNAPNKSGMQLFWPSNAAYIE